MSALRGARGLLQGLQRTGMVGVRVAWGGAVGQPGLDVPLAARLPFLRVGSQIEREALCAALARSTAVACVQELILPTPLPPPTQVTAHKLWTDVRAYKDREHFETPYVAKFHRCVRSACGASTGVCSQALLQCARQGLSKACTIPVLAQHLLCNLCFPLPSCVLPFCPELPQRPLPLAGRKGEATSLPHTSPSSPPPRPQALHPCAHAADVHLPPSQPRLSHRQQPPETRRVFSPRRGGLCHHARLCWVSIFGAFSVPPCLAAGAPAAIELRVWAGGAR